ncbi:MAG: hypothetical protein ACRD37_04750, partial [Candidatus Acidiferrales bacterium]
MKSSQLTPLWIFIGLVVLFAFVIYFGLKLRKASFAKNLDIRAQDIWPSLQGTGWNFSDLLYGVWQDFSATELGLIAKNSRDEEVGKITFHTGSRQRWITFECGGSAFEADVLATFRQSAALHAAGDNSQTLCVFSRLRGGVFHFDARSIGVLESKPPRGLRKAPLYEYTLNGQPVGICQHIGGWTDRGSYLVLPANIPLAIR